MNLAIKPDPDLEVPIDLSLLGEPLPNSTETGCVLSSDRAHGDAGRRPAKNGFRVIHLQEALSLNKDEFGNFKVR